MVVSSFCFVSVCDAFIMVVCLFVVLVTAGLLLFKLVVGCGGADCCICVGFRFAFVVSFVYCFLVGLLLVFAELLVLLLLVVGFVFGNLFVDLAVLCLIDYGFGVYCVVECCLFILLFAC